jgi:hypothetical protein
MTVETATIIIGASIAALSMAFVFFTRTRLKKPFRYALGLSHLLMILVIYIIVETKSEDALSSLYWSPAFALDMPISLLELPLTEIVGQYVKPGFNLVGLLFFGILGSLQYFLIGVLIDIAWLHIMAHMRDRIDSGIRN